MYGILYDVHMYYVFMCLCVYNCMRETTREEEEVKKKILSHFSALIMYCRILYDA